MTSGPDPDTAQDSLSLAGPEDQHSTADWEKATAAVLRKTRQLGDDAPDSAVWEQLTRTTLDGIGVAPLGTRDSVADLPAVGQPGAAPYTRGRLADKPEIGWDIRPHLFGLEAKPLNEAALADLENGSTSLWLEVGTTLGADDLAAALDGVFIDLAPVVLDAPEDPVAAADALAAVFADRGVDPAAGTNLGADPIAAQVRGVSTSSTTEGTSSTTEGTSSTTEGTSSTTDNDNLDVLELVATRAEEMGALGLVVDATAIHDRGASDAQELGYSLAVGAAYLRRLTAEGRSVDAALALMEFRYAATDEQFPTIAKFRAARRLWARVAELSGAAPEAGGQRQHAVTSRPMMSKYDPWVNMLRTTVAAFAAGVGGAEAVTVLPFDSTLGVPDAFGRRIARNTSSLLISESHVAKVVDPAGGSYAVEKLTDDLANAAWAEFGRIEEAGGIVAALEDGSLQSRIDAVVAERDDQVAHRTRPLTGVSEFPNLTETLPERPAHPSANAVRRYGAPFEDLRDEPATTPVFLATMGTIAAHTARATFASNLFAAGGISVVAAGATEDADAVLAAYDGQPVVCLAGADKAYAAWGAELVARLREAGARHVVLAGKPGDKTVSPDLVDDSAAVGVDALTFLTTTREKLA
ncbi:methylmalonyl-CoA mutase [Nocardioides sp. JQ2195]|uniref:methylmalonyl-CoA mutase family protein n=1 Tax=Nocardioides sp. JQ2195 TaxID=2592334 RepID=UPI00143E300B|nr:methylmalonyl-CoA mutase family protein [Nocardioides sp. JQ2195]QIX25876.1 methylmalonyl-CoA mutase [Nocardioides sp. JQ2195]